jgi:hypothetical protein
MERDLGIALRSPAGPGQSPRRGSRWVKPLPPKFWGFEELDMEMGKR